MMLEETYPLSNGVRIPKLGLGTWFIEDGRAAQAVHDAVGIGCRHFDAAQAYGNERGMCDEVSVAVAAAADGSPTAQTYLWPGNV